MSINSTLFTLCLLITPFSSCLAETHLHISTGFTPPVSDFYKSVLEEVDKRIDDITISFEILPAERSLALANQGINDGECCRIPAVVKDEYRNLIPIDTSFYAARFSAFTKLKDSTVKSFNDLKPYSVGSVKGWKIAVNKIKDVGPREVYIVTTPNQLFQMIEQNRLDYGVVGYLSGLQAITTLRAKDIYAVEPPLIEKKLYLMLHKKHTALIPLLNKTIDDMYADSTIANIYNKLILSLK